MKNWFIFIVPLFLFIGCCDKHPMRKSGDLRQFVVMYSDSSTDTVSACYYLERYEQIHFYCDYEDGCGGGRREVYKTVSLFNVKSITLLGDSPNK